MRKPYRNATTAALALLAISLVVTAAGAAYVRQSDRATMAELEVVLRTVEGNARAQSLLTKTAVERVLPPVLADLPHDPAVEFDTRFGVLRARGGGQCRELVLGDEPTGGGFRDCGTRGACVDRKRTVAARVVDVETQQPVSGVRLTLLPTSCEHGPFDRSTPIAEYAGVRADPAYSGSAWKLTGDDGTVEFDGKGSDGSAVMYADFAEPFAVEEIPVVVMRDQPFAPTERCSVVRTEYGGRRYAGEFEYVVWVECPRSQR